MIYLDANAIMAAAVQVVEEDRTEKMHQFLTGQPGPFHVSALAEYEAKKCLLSSGKEGWEADLESLLVNKLDRLTGGWEAAIMRALKLAREFKARLAVDSADTLHVGWSLSIGAEVFASFDRKSGPRALALCAGLKVWPEPDEKDWAAMRRLKA